MLNSIKVQDILLLILIIAVIYILFRSPPCNENFETTPVDSDAIKNLGDISRKIYTGGDTGVPGTLTIPANNTIISGNLNVDGNLNVKGNANKLILIMIEGYQGYNNSPLLDPNGFTIPADKYYYRINSDLLLLVINEKTRDWWCQDNAQYASVRINPIIIEFVPRTDYHSNTIFNETIVNFNNMKQSGKYVRVNGKNPPSENTTDKNPYK